jgi:murein DD-endopeptidase MepM/ murein hydrolase activator NlpD
LATAGSFYDFIQRKTSLERILSQDEAVLEKLRSDQMAVTSLLEQLNAKRAEKRALEIELGQRIAVLDREQKKRTAMLEKIRGRKELELAAFKSLRQSAKALDSTLSAFASGDGDRLSHRASGDSDDKRPFEKHKGLLSWPVKGKIISFFGPYRDEKANLVNFQSGINIRAERGEPIRAVSGGYAIYASWFKGFGNMLIIDHGNHYYTVYAHLEEVFKVKGDRIDKDEVIATVGNSGSLMGPALHFEIRHHGKPIDPLEWINKG